MIAPRDEKKAIAAKTVTYDLARQMTGATEVSTTGFGDARLKLGGVKLFLDGGASLGTALMREPYPDERCNCGIQVTPTESFRQIAWACARQGWSARLTRQGQGSG